MNAEFWLLVYQKPPSLEVLAPSGTAGAAGDELEAAEGGFSQVETTCREECPVHVKAVIKPNTYSDSMSLMALSTKVNQLPEVHQAMIGMGTGLNKQVIAEVGLSTHEVEAATPRDQIIVVQCDTEEICDEVLAKVEELRAEGMAKPAGATSYRTSRQAYENATDTSLAIITVPGEYAADEARAALDAGRHVLMFSDNVSVEDEISLKQQGHDAGLLVMGPDCGTAIINGVGLCFAIVVSDAPTNLPENVTFVANTLDAARAAVEFATGSAPAQPAPVDLPKLSFAEGQTDILGAETQGMIGYVIQHELGNALRWQREVVMILTTTVVDDADPAIEHPTKLIGPQYSAQDAAEAAAEYRWTIARDGDKFRRVAPSPQPIRVSQAPVIRTLVDQGLLVVCAGGGGVLIAPLDRLDAVLAS